MSNGRRTEYLFKKVAQEVGLEVGNPREIRCEKPVKNDKGKETKTLYLPDYYVTNRDTGKSVHVELRNGRKKFPHKKAQMRVLSASGVKNHASLTGKQVEEVNEEPTLAAKKAKLFSLLGWILLC